MSEAAIRAARRRRQIFALVFSLGLAGAVFGFVLSSVRQETSAKSAATGFRSTIPGAALRRAEEGIQSCAVSSDECQRAMANMRAVAMQLVPLEKSYDLCLNGKDGSAERCGILVSVISSSTPSRSPAPKKNPPTQKR